MRSIFFAYQFSKRNQLNIMSNKLIYTHSARKSNAIFALNGINRKKDFSTCCLIGVAGNRRVAELVWNLSARRDTSYGYCAHHCSTRCRDEFLESWTGAASCACEHAIEREIFARDHALAESPNDGPPKPVGACSNVNVTIG